MREAYFNEDNFCLYLGDSMEIMRQIEDNYVDMIFADPPYNLSNGGFTCHNGKKVSVNKGDWDVSRGPLEDFNFHLRWISECRRVLKPGGTIWISGTYHSIYQCGYALQVSNFHILNEICWFKPNASPNLSCRFFTASHETLVWARKEKKSRHIFNYHLMKNGDWKKDFLKDPASQMRSVWAVDSPNFIEKKFGKHPTQKPAELLKRIILASTNKGDLILDPFAGSSTTGIVAYSYGRKFIGIDFIQDYIKLSVKRFANIRENIKKNT